MTTPMPRSPVAEGLNAVLREEARRLGEESRQLEHTASEKLKRGDLTWEAWYEAGATLRRTRDRLVGLIEQFGL